jgi:DNA-binding LacI/PurR family transcriptional regulator
VSAQAESHLSQFGHFDPDRAAQATRELFAGQPSSRPDALFVMNDYMAFRVMAVLRGKLGLRVPEDVAVMGFDDLPTTSAPEYNLTTVRQPLDQMVSHAIRILVSELEGSGLERVAPASVFVRRGSTDVKVA